MNNNEHVLEYKDETLKDLATHGIADDSAWDDWCHFSDIQAANCLAVLEDAVLRFKTWRQTRNPDDAWS